MQPILFLSKDSSIKANLAGYGQYYRRDMSGDNVQRCETDEYGRNKYHMCAKSGTGEQVCHTDTPAPRTPACQAFFNQTGLAYPEEFEEIQLVGESGATVDFCYGSASPVPKSRGWCETNQSYYGFKERDEAGGWGFCSGDCYLGDIAAEKDTGVLRMLRDIDVLPDSVCDAFLKGQLLHEMSLGLFFCLGIKFTLYPDSEVKTGSFLFSDILRFVKYPLWIPSVELFVLHLESR